MLSPLFIEHMVSETSLIIELTPISLEEVILLHGEYREKTLKNRPIPTILSGWGVFLRELKLKKIRRILLKIALVLEHRRAAIQNVRQRYGGIEGVNIAH